jgi:predicted transcriptional regulator
MGQNDQPLFDRVLRSGLGYTLIRFDWSGITVATGSYLKAAYLPIFQKRSAPLLISSDLADTVAEDLLIVLENQGLQMLVAKRVKRKQYDISVTGELDAAYRETLDVVRAKRSVTAGALFDEDKKNIGKTAWMNRLSRLYEMGLLTREKIGKEYRYSFPSIKEI